MAARTPTHDGDFRFHFSLGNVFPLGDALPPAAEGDFTLEGSKKENHHKERPRRKRSRWSWGRILPSQKFNPMSQAEFRSHGLPRFGRRSFRNLFANLVPDETMSRTWRPPQGWRQTYSTSAQNANSSGIGLGFGGVFHRSDNSQSGKGLQHRQNLLVSIFSTHLRRSQLHPEPVGLRFHRVDCNSSSLRLRNWWASIFD